MVGRASPVALTAPLPPALRPLGGPRFSVHGGKLEDDCLAHNTLLFVAGHVQALATDHSGSQLFGLWSRSTREHAAAGAYFAFVRCV